MVKFIDTHCHLNFQDFKNDADEIIRYTLKENIWMILVGTDKQTSRNAIDLANKYESGVFASVGLHPLHIKPEGANNDYDFNPSLEHWSRDTYERLANFEKVIAIGEIGLDYYHLSSKDDITAIKEKQAEAFVGQVLLARQMDLPVIIHCRAAHDDMMLILKDFRKNNKELFIDKGAWGVMHCFSGTENEAWEYFKMGLIISFTGIITFTNQYDDLIKKIPSDKFIIETDTPYLTPVPFRGQRNEPMLVKYVADKISRIKHLTLKRVGEITTKNARRLFKI